MTNNYYMELALKEALKAYKNQEVPVGAIIVRDNKIISKAYNKKEKMKDVSAHAEILAIRKAEKKLNNWRLDECQLYTTLEPCPMCMAAIKEARIKNVYFGAYDRIMGACGSKIDIRDINFQTPNVSVIGGIEEERCLKLLQSFFKELRNQ